MTFAGNFHIVIAEEPNFYGTFCCIAEKRAPTRNVISLRFFSSAVLHEVYVEDQQQDTLFWFDELAVAIDDISTENRRIDIGKLTLEDGYFQLLHKKGSPHDNLYFLLDYFSSTDTTPSGSAPWKISVKEVELDGFRFTYHEIGRAHV